MILVYTDDGARRLTITRLIHARLKKETACPTRRVQYRFGRRWRNDFNHCANQRTGSEELPFVATQSRAE